MTDLQSVMQGNQKVNALFGMVEHCSWPCPSFQQKSFCSGFGMKEAVHPKIEIQAFNMITHPPTEKWMKFLGKQNNIWAAQQNKYPVKQLM